MSAPLHAFHVHFRDGAHFLQEYDANLNHGGLVLHWGHAPSPGTPVKVELVLPHGGLALALEGLVVLAMGENAVLQLQVDPHARVVLEQCAAQCRLAGEDRPAGGAAAKQVHAMVAPEEDVTLELKPVTPTRPDRTLHHAHAPPHHAHAPTHHAHAPAPHAPTHHAPHAPAGPPRPPPLREWSGRLEEQSVEQVLMAIFERHATGRLALGEGAEGAEIYLERGAVVAVIDRGSRRDRFLGEALVKSGKLRSRDRDLAVAQANEEHVPLGEILVRRGVLTAPMLKEALRRQLIARIFDQLQRKTGPFVFVEGARPVRAPRQPPVPVPAALFRAKADAYGARAASEIDEVEGPYNGLYVHRGKGAPADMSTRGLDEDEQRVWAQVVSGAYTLREIYAVSDLTRRRTHALLWALRDLGYVALEREMAPRFRLERLAESLGRKVGQANSGTLFDVLDLHWMADATDVKRGYAKVVESYAVPALDIPVPPDVHRMSAEILEKAAEARDRLLPDRERRAYRRTVIEPAQIESTAEILLRQADIDAYRHAFGDAEYRYAHVVELDPSNAEVRAKLADTRTKRAHQLAHLHDPAGQAGLDVDVDRFLAAVSRR